MIKDGIININKPAGMTSHDVVARVRRKLGIKKVGHTGTLDPMAEGVLPVCFGKATRIIEYLDADVKEYRCSMRLGLRSDTGDIWGNVTDAVKPADGIDAVTRALTDQVGLRCQKPPMYSARKVDGKRLYEYARAGQTVEITGRDIYIYGIDDIKFEKGAPQDNGAAGEDTSFTIRCSKGTYVRTVCTDAGEALGTSAVMTGLTRTASGVFNLENSVSLETFMEMELPEIEKIVFPPDYPLTSMGIIRLSPFDSRRLITGLPVWTSRCKVEKEPEYKDKDFVLPISDAIKGGYLVYGSPDNQDAAGSRETGGVGDKFLGVAVTTEDGVNIKADKVFYR